MSGSEQEERAGEYVLGTLPADERSALERELPTDAGLRDAVRAWTARLDGLNALVPDAQPDPAVWSAIERRLGPAAAGADVLRLRRALARWRGAAILAGAVAACLALYVGTGLRAPAAPAYVAVVNRGGDLPALIVEVDTRSETVRIRPVAAEAPRDRALQLWFIAADGGAPRSLGILGGGVQTASFPPAPPGGDLAGGTLAVSVEPVGGSPAAGPTGPVIYSGKLLRQ